MSREGLPQGEWRRKDAVDTWKVLSERVPSGAEYQGNSVFSRFLLRCLICCPPGGGDSVRVEGPALAPKACEGLLLLPEA